MADILLVEDQDGLRESVRISLARAGHRVRAESSLGGAREALAQGLFSLVIADLRLGDGSGLELLPLLDDRSDRPTFIAMTAYSSVDVAVKAMQRGAFDFIPKPFSPERLTASVERALTHHRLRVQVERIKSGEDTRIEGSSSSSRELRSLVEKAKEARVVLLTGETGTGKGRVARAIRKLLPSGAPFIPIHCGALPESLAESELFGHVRGAFSGAEKARPGLLAEADGGIAFLDEVGELPLSLQTRLLRFLETGEIRPVGADHPIHSSCQVVAATHRDLAKDCRNGRFRQDLLYRLDVFRVHVPPLRERMEDLEEIADSIVTAISERLRRPTIPTLSKEARRLLHSHNWPGNIRELEHTLERALLLSKATELPAGLLEACLGEPEFEEARAESQAASSAASSDATIQPLEDVERRHILATLEHFGGDRSKAARALGIARSTLRRKLIAFEA